MPLALEAWVVALHVNGGGEQAGLLEESGWVCARGKTRSTSVQVNDRQRSTAG